MGFRDLKILAAYDTRRPGVDVLRDFYVPVLATTVQYDRMAGYFSSASLAVAARGIAGLIRANGKMRLIASPHFSPVDFAVLEEAHDPEKLAMLAGDAAISELNIDQLTDHLAADHVRALAWMLANDRLEIRLAFVRKRAGRGEALFHLKTGVMVDVCGDKIAYSGSINETATGWLENAEQFKVFKSWKPGGMEHIQEDIDSFTDYWEGSVPGVEVVPMSDAARERLIRLAPAHITELVLDLDVARNANSPMISSFSLRAYQEDAVDAWFSNGCHGVFEMATGTGKTKTAVAAIERLFREPGPHLVVVTAPYQQIAVQWRDEFQKHSPIVAYGGTPWAQQLANALTEVDLGLRQQVTVIAVQDTAASAGFTSVIERASAYMQSTTVIGDEVHALGAPKTRRSLLQNYTHRLGLSATPSRWFDDDGSRALNDFFGPTVFEFGLAKALAWRDPITGEPALCEYRYFPKGVRLNGDELNQYSKLTRQLIALSEKTDAGSEERRESLLFRRAAIIKTAAQKLSALRSVLDEIGDVQQTLIYCHDKEQMGLVGGILHERGIRYSRFTGEEGTAARPEFGGMSEREKILESLASGQVQALVAMKCLDEGVDVPSASIGIILASSTNPREYIQRRGRLLRRASGKRLATIYDVIVLPSLHGEEYEVARKFEYGILDKELERIRDFGETAENSLHVSTWVLDRLQELNH